MARYTLKYSGIPLTLSSKPFAGGGEGNLYKITSPRELRHYVAKLYHPNKLSADRERKINYLAEYPPSAFDQRDGEHAAVVWVKDAIYQRDKFVGFIMPYTSGEKLEILCTLKIPRKLQSEWKRFDFKNGEKALDLRLKLCFNICSAIHQVHSVERYVLVDMKPDNILIQPNGLVSIVDTDSVEVVEGGQSLFDAPVATPEYSPPEHYKDLSVDPTGNTAWDRFGLGVILYKVLLGIHPFAATAGYPYDHLVSLDDKIKEGLFVHHPDKQRFFQMVPPPHKAFYKLHSSLQTLFIRCFVDGHDDPEQRPTAEEWLATILLSFGDEAAYQRYGHILSGHSVSQQPRFAKPSAFIDVPIPNINVSKVIALSDEKQIPEPQMSYPTNQMIKGFDIDPYTRSKAIGTILAPLMVLSIGGPLVAIIMIVVLSRLYGKYKEEDSYKLKELNTKRLNQTRRKYKQLKNKAKKEQRRFKKTVRRTLPEIERIAKRVKNEIAKLKEFLAKQDQAVQNLEKKAVEAYKELNQRYVNTAQENRAIARIEEGSYDTLSKIRIALDRSHKIAIDTLTRANPIHAQHPDIKEGKIAINALVKEKRIEVDALVGKKMTKLKEEESAEIEAILSPIRERADMVKQVDRLFKGMRGSVDKLRAEFLDTLNEWGVRYITDIDAINTRSGIVTLRNGKKQNIRSFYKAQTMLRNLLHWFDEIKHDLSSFKKQKLKLQQHYSKQKKAIQEEKRIELRDLDRFKRERIKAVEKEVQMVALGAEYSNLQQEYETVTEYVTELEHAYDMELELALENYNDEYEVLIEETKDQAATIQKQIKKLEKELSNQSKKLNSSRVRKSYRRLEKDLDELKGLVPQLERKEFEAKQLQQITFGGFVRHMFKNIKSK